MTDADLHNVERLLGTRYEDSIDVAGLVTEVRRLQAAIKEHRDCKGDDRCWLDDETLYAAAGLEFCHTALPPECEFLESCRRFWRERQRPTELGTFPMPKDMTIAQLTEEVERLQAENAQLGTDLKNVLRHNVYPCNNGYYVLGVWFKIDPFPTRSEAETAYLNFVGRWVNWPRNKEEGRDLSP